MQLKSHYSPLPKHKPLLLFHIAFLRISSQIKCYFSQFLETPRAAEKHMRSFHARWPSPGSGAAPPAEHVTVTTETDSNTCTCEQGGLRPGQPCRTVPTLVLDEGYQNRIKCSSEYWRKKMEKSTIGQCKLKVDNKYIYHNDLLVLEKAEDSEIKLPTSTGSWKKQESSRKTSIPALLTMPKPLTLWITINCGKFWKTWEYQTTWPASWEICMQVRKQQLELDMEQQTGSK